MQLLTAVDETNSFLESSELLEDIKKTKEYLEPGQMSKFIDRNLPKVIEFGIRMLLCILVFVVVSKLIKYLRRILKKSLGLSSINDGVIHFVDLFVNIALHFILISSIVVHLNIVKEASVAALLGTVGLTLGLALQGSLANFAGGVLVLILHPFKVGDYITENTDKNEGTVLKIELFYTTLVTADNKIITIPNGTLSNSSIVNATAADKRRLDLKIGISYESDLQLAKQVILDILLSNSKILENESIDVFVEELGANAVILGCRAWSSLDEFWNCKYEVTEAIKLNFDANHINIAHNQLDIHVNEKPLQKNQ